MRKRSQCVGVEGGRVYLPHRRRAEEDCYKAVQMVCTFPGVRFEPAAFRIQRKHATSAFAGMDLNAYYAPASLAD